jgi:HEAT repeat protein
MRPPKAFGVPVPYDVPLDDLRARLELPGPMAWAACLALAHRPEPEALALLVSLAKRPEFEYRNLAVQAIADHALGAQAAETVINALSDSVPQVVRTACDAAGKLRLEAARPKLLSLLVCDDAQARLQAVRALGEIWTHEDYALILECSKKDKAEFVRKEAAKTLRRTVTAKNWRHLFDRWKRDKSPQNRVWACEILGDFGADPDMSELHRLRRDPNRHVREAGERLAALRGMS